MIEIRPEQVETYAGMLLIAHPSMRDPHFAKTVVLVSIHTREEGSMGVIINRPLGETLGSQSSHFVYGPLAELPVFEGGPVHPEQIILAAWDNSEQDSFKLYFALTEEKAVELQTFDPNIFICAFLGYAGWTNGQLEGEHRKNAWIASPAVGQNLNVQSGVKLWKSYLKDIRPELSFVSDAPDDPSRN